MHSAGEWHASVRLRELRSKTTCIVCLLLCGYSLALLLGVQWCSWTKLDVPVEFDIRKWTKSQTSVVNDGPYTFVTKADLIVFRVIVLISSKTWLLGVELLFQRNVHCILWGKESNKCISSNVSSMCRKELSHYSSISVFPLGNRSSNCMAVE